MELNEETEALLRGLEEVSGNNKSELVKEAVESYAENVGRNLILQQGNMNKNDLEVNEDG